MSEITEPPFSVPARPAPVFFTRHLFPPHQAAPIFLEKMDAAKAARFGATAEEQLATLTGRLAQVARESFGVMSIADTADLLGMAYPTLQSGAGGKRESYFPGAMSYKRDPATGEVAWPNGSKQLCIFHAEFVLWYRDRYNPRRPRAARCKLNDLVTGPDGELLPESERPVYVFRQDDGTYRSAAVEPCQGAPREKRNHFCPETTHGLKHHHIYNLVTGAYAGAGRASAAARELDPTKRASGPRIRSVQETRRRRQAQQKGRRARVAFTE